MSVQHQPVSDPKQLPVLPASDPEQNSNIQTTDEQIFGV
jgi:hypothetical protein